MRSPSRLRIAEIRHEIRRYRASCATCGSCGAQPGSGTPPPVNFTGPRTPAPHAPPASGPAAGPPSPGSGLIREIPGGCPVGPGVRSPVGRSTRYLREVSSFLPLRRVCNCSLKLLAGRNRGHTESRRISNLSCYKQDTAGTRAARSTHYSLHGSNSPSRVNDAYNVNGDATRTHRPSPEPVLSFVAF